uniref:Uncharacterized protein n=1 Tax=Panagrolaimus davidi TaxID=227884 RepID=A0A914RAY7_9BILA
MNVTSIEDVPETQKENLRIENGYAIIEMKAGDDLKEYNASFLLNQNESLIFVFNVTYNDTFQNYLNLTLNSSDNVNSTMISLKYGNFFSSVIFMFQESGIGTFADTHSMTFELLPDGTLTNNGSRSSAIPKIFPVSDAEIQEDNGKRRIDFLISWKNKVYGEFMIPLNQFAVEVPPTTTTSTTTTSTTTETSTTTTTPKKLVTENTKPSTKKKSSVAKASISETSDEMIWGIGLFIFAVLYLIVIGVAVYFYRKKKRELRAKARTSYSPLATHPKKNGGNIQTTKLPNLPPADATQVPSNALKSNPLKTAKPPSAPAKQALVTKSAVPVPTKPTPMIKSAEQTKPTPLTKNVEPAPVPKAAATNMKSTEPAKPAQLTEKVEPAPIVPTKIPPTQPTTTGPKPASQLPPSTKSSDEKKMTGTEFGKPGENYVEFATLNEKK